MDWTKPGGFPPQVGPKADVDANELQHIGYMRVSTVGRINVRGGTGGGGEIYPPAPKHYIPIYRNLSNIGALYGGGV